MRPLCVSPPAAFLAVLALAAAIPAFAADTPAPAVLPAVGKTLHYRITRTAQGNSGQRVAVSNVTLHRKSATTLTLAGVFGEPPSVMTILTVGANGDLAIPADKPGGADSALGDVVNGLNRLQALFAGQTTIPHDGYSASLQAAGVRGAGGVSVPLAVENASGRGFDLHGVGQSTIEAQASVAAAPYPGGNLAQRAAARRGGFRNRPGFSGGSPQGGPQFGDPAAGGAFGAAEGTPGSAAVAGATARPQVSVTISVDGRFRNGAIGKVSIVETRAVTVDDQPYVNVSGWTIEATK